MQDNLPLRRTTLSERLAEATRVMSASPAEGLLYEPGGQVYGAGWLGASYVLNATAATVRQRAVVQESHMSLLSALISKGKPAIEAVAIGLERLGATRVGRTAQSVTAAARRWAIENPKKSQLLIDVLAQVGIYLTVDELMSDDDADAIAGGDARLRAAITPNPNVRQQMLAAIAAFGVQAANDRQKTTGDGVAGTAYGQPEADFLRESAAHTAAIFTIQQQRKTLGWSWEQVLAMRVLMHAEDVLIRAARADEDLYGPRMRTR